MQGKKRLGSPSPTSRTEERLHLQFDLAVATTLERGRGKFGSITFQSCFARGHLEHLRNLIGKNPFAAHSFTMIFVSKSSPDEKPRCSCVGRA